MKKKLYCDIDSTINNHWVRIKKWSKNDSKKISWRAFTKAELMKDEPLPNAKKALTILSNEYKIIFLTARGFNKYKNGRIFPEKCYNKPGGQIFLKINNYLSLLHSYLMNTKKDMTNKYAFSITDEWLKKNEFIYDELIIVDNIYDKIEVLKNNQCDLYIDDMSWGQNYTDSYKMLYDDFIVELDRMNIKYEIFNDENNWLKILQKY